MVEKKRKRRHHPFNVVPEGNAFLLKGEDACEERLLRRDHGLGVLGSLPDRLFIHVLECLDWKSLGRMSICSRMCFVFCSHEPLWRDLALEHFKCEALDRLQFKGTWRLTLLRQPSIYSLPVELLIASDELYRPFQFASGEIEEFWLRREVVEIRDYQTLNVEEFVADFESKRVPVVIKNGLKSEWKAFQDWNKVDDGKSLQLPRSREKFRVGPIEMRLDDFLHYIDTQHEENSLYLFDCKFAERIPDFGKIYEMPKFFQNSELKRDRDLLEYLGRSRRPDYRWLIAGAKRSGSKWHIDPNGTHAWNVAVSGRKKWMFFPPGSTPPGVTPSADGMDVMQPISLMEWFCNFYNVEEIPVEFIAKPGDLVFVPAGWWHAVLNIEPSVAITQNYISATNLNSALRLMKYTPHLVSGLPEFRPRHELYGEFRHALEDHGFQDLLKRFDDAEAAKLERRNFTFSFF